MLILSLDSAGQACAACVWRDGKALAVSVEKMERGQDSRLVPLVLDVMACAGTDFDALDRIAVTRGPGSFTGLRIGLAAARGFGLAAGKPVVGIDRFSIYREQHNRHGEDLLVVIESKRQELFCRLYPADGEPKEGCMMTHEDIAALVRERPRLAVCGDVCGALHPALALESKEPEAVTSAALASRADPCDPAFWPRPLYLRAPDVTLKRK